MALSKVIKVGDGVTRQFAVSFELGYIREEDITAWVEGEYDGTGAPIYRAITFLTPEMLEIAGTVPASGTQIIFERTVPRDRLLVDYEDGDIINDDNLNTSQKQALMLIHELLDGRFETFDADVDYGGFRIINLGNPVDPTDAANKQYVDAVVQTGADSAAAAAISAGQAAGSASAAATSASTAEGWKNKAQEWAISGTIVDATDYSSKWWANQANTWAQAVNPGNFVLKSGDTMTGPLFTTALDVTRTGADWASLSLSSLERAQVDLRHDSVLNWSILKDTQKNFYIGRYNPANGNWVDNPFNISISTGKVNLSQRPAFGIWTPWDNSNLPNPINDAPSDSSTYARKNAAWVKSVGGAIMSDTAPPSPENGQKWINTLTMREYTWYVDGTSSQWVETTNSDAQRPASDGNDYVMRNGVWIKAARQLILSGDASNVVTVPIDINFTDYTSVDVEWSDMDLANSSSYIMVQFRRAGTWLTSNYFWTTKYTTASSDSYWHQGSSGGSPAGIFLTSAATLPGNFVSGNFKLYGAQGPDGPQITSRSSHDQTISITAGYNNSSGTLDGIRFIATAGNISRIRYAAYGNRR